MMKDPAECDWTQADVFDCAMMARGGVQEAIDECKRRGIHLPVVHRPAMQAMIGPHHDA
jgi:hypothetical protein